MICKDLSPTQIVKRESKRMQRERVLLILRNRALTSIQPEDRALHPSRFGEAPPVARVGPMVSLGGFASGTSQRESTRR